MSADAITIISLELHGAWGRSLRDPTLIGAGDIELPEPREFRAWSWTMLAGRRVWIPAPGAGERPQAAVLGSAAAIGCDGRVVCVDLAGGSVLHEVRPAVAAFNEFLTLDGDRVLAIFDAAVTEISPARGLLWQREMPDMIVDWELRDGTLGVALDDGRWLRIDPRAELAS
jgi:hypothetical protein